jgi:hypothetical protein
VIYVKNAVLSGFTPPGEAGTKKLDNDFFNGLFKIFRVRDQWVRPLRHPVHAPDDAWLRYNSL